MLNLHKQRRNRDILLFLNWCLNFWGESDLFRADERRHDAHVWRQEELQAHDEDGQDSKRHQLQTVVHQLHRDTFTQADKQNWHSCK